MIAPRRRWTDAPKAPGDAGITLAELLVALMVFGIILTLTGGLFVSIIRTTAVARVGNDNTKSASVGVNEISRVLRVATTLAKLNQSINDPAFISASSESIVFTAYADVSSAAPKPIQVQFALDSSRRLVETRWEMSASSSGFWQLSGAAPTSRVLAGPVPTWTAGNPQLFEFHDSSEAVLGVPVDRASIASVLVTLKVQTDAGTAGSAVVVQNLVGLPNLGIKRTGQNG